MFGWGGFWPSLDISSLLHVLTFEAHITFQEKM